MTRLVRLLGLCALVLLPQATAAQGVAGAWKLEYVRRVTNDGSGEQAEMGHARVLLDVHGDSVVATWQALEPGPDGKALPARVIHGTVSGDHVILKSQAQARMMRNGDVSTVELTITYDLTVKGDTIAGVQLADAADGSMSPPARPIHGEREQVGTPIKL
jgi:hypothetical protein